jgi:hypothetical protein
MMIILQKFFEEPETPIIPEPSSVINVDFNNMCGFLTDLRDAAKFV